MRKFAGLFVVSILMTTAGHALAQDSGTFSGKGIGDGWCTSKGSPETGSSAFGFHQGEKASPLSERTGLKIPKFELPKWKMPNWEMPKLFQGNKFPNPVQLSDSKGMFSNLPKFELPKRDPSQPNFFQRMNDRTKEIFGKTRSGIANATNSAFDNVDQTAKGSWDKITRGFNGDIGGSGNRNQPPVQPNFRSARQTDGSSPKYQ